MSPSLRCFVVPRAARCRVAVVAVALALISPAHAEQSATPSTIAHPDKHAPERRTLAEYRWFRALSVDLLGRAPRRDELHAFETPGFDIDHWIDQHLEGASYAERLARVYMDELRLEVGPAVTYAPPSVVLRRQLIKGPNGDGIYVYYRQGQRRKRAVTDGEFCLSEAESGLAFPTAGTAVGTAKPVSAAALEENTVRVKPWWLYRDYDDEVQPSQWIPRVRDPDPLFQPGDDLTTEPDGSAAVSVRVCREEANTADTGTIFVAGHPAPPAPAKKNDPKAPPSPAVLPPGRFRPFPNDDGYAKAHVGEKIACRSAGALTMSTDCGCGVGLAHCLPGDGGGNNPRAFILPTRSPIGAAAPLGENQQSVSDWQKFWWSEEVNHFLGYVFAGDRDLRELLTARYDLVDGPVAEFYRSGAAASCCDREKAFGMVESAEPLVDPRVVPADLRPSDTRTWKLVPDRGPHAAGLITMPAFMAKYASRRARAAALYTTFLCKSFSADKTPLAPSKEPNLTVRPGCASCHATLEPLAAYFSRIEEGGFTFLPAWRFPLRNLTCRIPEPPKGKAAGDKPKLPGQCGFFYDPDFSDATGGLLRGAYAAPEHAAAGAAGVASAIAEAPEFAGCATKRITASFLGRRLTSDDDALIDGLTKTFEQAGRKPRALVRAILQSPAYRQARLGGGS